MNIYSWGASWTGVYLALMAVILLTGCKATDMDLPKPMTTVVYQERPTARLPSACWPEAYKDAVGVKKTPGGKTPPEAVEDSWARNVVVIGTNKVTAKTCACNVASSPSAHPEDRAKAAKICGRKAVS